ncbi:hypothetical protein DL768_010426 [Monosporascus sp. mg162]|nr:hypothetical protein DL768_010426 [Monosporascus sp. mg162]
MSTGSQNTSTQQLQAKVRRLEAELQRLANQVRVAPSIASTASQMKPKKPEPYNGKGNPQTFLTQARIYLRFLDIDTPADQILAVVACLTGDAANWFEPIMRNYLEVGESNREKATNELFSLYTNFEDKKGPASKYAVTFKGLAAKAGYGDGKADALIDMFYKGLKDEVKDEIIRVERPTTFDKYIAEAIKHDNRQFERRQKKKGQYVPRSGHTKPNQGRKRDAPPTSYGTAPGPMELGTTQRRDWSQVKCYNYNKMGHKAAWCKAPKRPRQDKPWTPVPEGQSKSNDKNKTFNMIRRQDEGTGPSRQEIRRGLREAKKLSQSAVKKQKHPQAILREWLEGHQGWAELPETTEPAAQHEQRQYKLAAARSWPEGGTCPQWDPFCVYGECNHQTQEELVQRTVEKHCQRAITDLHFQLAFTTNPHERGALKGKLQNFTQQLWKGDTDRQQWEAVREMEETFVK